MVDYEKLLSELKRTVDELQAFNELGKTITSTLDISEVLKIIMKKISELLKPECWALLLVDDSTRELVFEIVVGEEMKGLLKKRIPMNEGIPGYIAKERKNILYPDPTKIKEYSLPEDLLKTVGKQSIAGVPLVSKGKILGVIELLNTDASSDPFTENDISLLATFADYAAIAIENAKAFQRIQELTITDDVTSLYNSRHMHHLLESEVLRAKRYRQHFCLVFIDLDHFKHVNDNHGHLIGSQLLGEFGEFLLKHIRDIDIATRYGGDEFVLILPQADREAGLTAAKRLCSKVASHRFCENEGLSIKITASFGVAAFPEDASTKNELLRLADEAMYYVKETSRNGVASAADLPEGRRQSPVERN